MATAATVSDGRHAYRPQAIGRVFGWFFLATFLTSIPAYFVGYHQMLNNPGLITGAGASPARGIATGAMLEVFLIISNVATAVVAYPVLKRESEMGAIGYVAARLVEAMFIAIGIVSALAFVLMRQEATAASNPVLGHVFVSIYYRAFLVGPGFFAGLANGVILGYLMYRSELVPRGMTWLGLIGGPLVMITGVLVMYDAIARGGAIQTIATLPEALWELSLSIYCIVKGFRLASPILRPDGVTTQAHPLEGEEMPKVSRATASSHQPIPGVLDAYSHEIDGWTSSMETHLTDLDAAFLFKGAPDDQCQAPHMGYVLKGKYGMRIVEGVEVFEAGDAFFIGPGHTPIIFAGCEVVYFTRTEEANRELPVVMANLMKYLEEQGMEVPAAPQPSPQLGEG